MKRFSFLCLLLAGALGLVAAGCGGSTSDDTASTGGANAGAGGAAGSGTAGAGGDSGQAGSGQVGGAGSGGDSGSAGAAGAGAAGASTSCPAECHHGCTYSNKQCGQKPNAMVACIPTAPTPSCGDVDSPVCGCDGKVYKNPCLLTEAGLDASQLGNCTVPPGHFVCGEFFCKQGAEYCGGTSSDIGNEASSYQCEPLPASCNAPGGDPCACFANLGCGMFCQVDEAGDIKVICPGG